MYSGYETVHDLTSPHGTGPEKNCFMMRGSKDCKVWTAYAFKAKCLRSQSYVINRIYDGVEAETRKSQASFQII